MARWYDSQEKAKEGTDAAQQKQIFAEERRPATLHRDGRKVYLTDIATAAFLVMQRITVAGREEVQQHGHPARLRRHPVVVFVFDDPDHKAEALALEFMTHPAHDYLDALNRTRSLLTRFHGKI